jgi:hypothetical protein
MRERNIFGRLIQAVHRARRRAGAAEILPVTGGRSTGVQSSVPTTGELLRRLFAGGEVCGESASASAQRLFLAAFQGGNGCPLCPLASHFSGLVERSS